MQSLAYSQKSVKYNQIPTNINAEGLVNKSGIFNLTAEVSNGRHDVTAYTIQINVSIVISVSVKCCW